MVVMGTFNRLLGMATKALGSQQDGRASQSGSGSSDWRDMVRNAADRITGDDRAAQPQTDRSPAGAPTQRTPAGASAPRLDQRDREALARYDYLLRTAPPERLEQVHAEAFARLSPEQRDAVRARLDAELPAGERPRSADGPELARAATRGEASRPGFMKRVLGGSGGRAALVGGGLAAAGGLAVAVAGGAVLSAAAGPVLAEAANLGVDFAGLADVGDGLTASVEGLAGDLGGSVSEAAASGGEALGGLGEQARDLGSGFGIPGLDDLFGGR